MRTAIGIKHYVIYAPRRRRKPRLTIYRLENGQYQPLVGNPVWLPEVGLAIGTGIGTYQGTNREWLYWYDEGGSRYPTQDGFWDQETWKQGDFIRKNFLSPVPCSLPPCSRSPCLQIFFPFPLTIDRFNGYNGVQ
ncbi:MAG: hypothetical protein F6J93_12100 [Oscillatoria sp. SIO1A7]|nr:hypothetical protein [Oscillatoria sp. SIO1A7]